MMGSFESKNAVILFASLKDARKQSTVEQYVNDCSVSERIVLFLPTMCYQLLTYLLDHQIDPLLLLGDQACTHLKVLGAKI